MEMLNASKVIVYLGREWKVYFCHDCRDSVIHTPAGVSKEEAFEVCGWREKSERWHTCKDCLAQQSAELVRAEFTHEKTSTKNRRFAYR